MGKVDILTIIVFFALNLAVPFYGKDDDIEFARSLNDSGYYWIAEKEWQEVIENGNEQDKLTALKGLASLYNKTRDYKNKEKVIEDIITYSESRKDPQLLKLVNKLKKEKLQRNKQLFIDLSHAIENELQSFQPDERKLSVLADRAEKAFNEIIPSYRESFANYEKAKTKSKSRMKRFEKSKFSLGKILYFYSFVFKDENPVKQKEILEQAYDEYLSKVNFKKKDEAIEVPFIKGLALFELERYNEATGYFYSCIKTPSTTRNRTIRKESYHRTVESYFRIQRFRACAETAVTYLQEFKKDQHKVPYKELLLQSRLSSSISRLALPGKTVSFRKAGRGYIVSTIRMQRARLAGIGAMRTYTIEGTGASAVIELPSIKVESVSSTIAIPSN